MSWNNKKHDNFYYTWGDHVWPFFVTICDSQEAISTFFSPLESRLLFWSDSSFAVTCEVEYPTFQIYGRCAICKIGRDTHYYKRFHSTSALQQSNGALLLPRWTICDNKWTKDDSQSEDRRKWWEVHLMARRRVATCSALFSLFRTSPPSSPTHASPLSPRHSRPPDYKADYPHLFLHCEEPSHSRCQRKR